MPRTNGVSYRDACLVCLGDLVEDDLEEGWLVCVICARSFPTAEIEAMQEQSHLALGASKLPGPRRQSSSAPS